MCSRRGLPYRVRAVASVKRLQSNVAEGVARRQAGMAECDSVRESRGSRARRSGMRRRMWRRLDCDPGAGDQEPPLRLALGRPVDDSPGGVTRSRRVVDAPPHHASGSHPLAVCRASTFSELCSCGERRRAWGLRERLLQRRRARLDSTAGRVAAHDRKLPGGVLGCRGVFAQACERLTCGLGGRAKPDEPPPSRTRSSE